MHVWETTTVEHLINPFAWIYKVRSATSDLGNLVFLCALDTTLILESRELWIVEPLQAADVGSQGAISLVYQVKIRWIMSSSATSAQLALAPQSGPRYHGDGSRSHRRPRSRSPWGGSREDAKSLSIGGLGQCRPAKESSRVLRLLWEVCVMVQEACIVRASRIPLRIPRLRCTLVNKSVMAKFSSRPILIASAARIIREIYAQIHATCTVWALRFQQGRPWLRCTGGS